MKKNKNIFIAATGQNVGKTTTSMGLFFKLVQKKIKAGFIKPIGQRYIEVGDVKVDEDSYLLNQVYETKCKLKDMNPIAVPRGFTERYIDQPNKKTIKESVLDSYNRIQADKEFVVIEGTGHAGVGSVLDASNSEVASWLDSKVIIVTNGGIGRAIDELTLNKTLFDQAGVEILGVVINKVLENKYEKIRYYTEKGLKRLGLKLLGVVPYKKQLINPNIEQVCRVVKGSIIVGENRKYNDVENVVVGAMSVRHLLDFIEGHTLLITPGDREDIILAAIASAHHDQNNKNRVCGILITARINPNPKVMELIKSSPIPIILCTHNTFDSASLVHDLTVKIEVNDEQKIKLSQKIFDEHIHFEYIWDNC